MSDQSLEHFDLRVLRRGNLKRRCVCALDMRVKKATHAVRGHGELASPIDLEQADRVTVKPCSFGVERQGDRVIFRIVPLESAK